jgi:hypothetical protein
MFWDLGGPATSVWSTFLALAAPPRSRTITIYPSLQLTTQVCGVLVPFVLVNALLMASRITTKFGSQCPLKASCLLISGYLMLVGRFRELGRKSCAEVWVGNSCLAVRFRLVCHHSYYQPQPRSVVCDMWLWCRNGLSLWEVSHVPSMGNGALTTSFLGKWSHGFEVRRKKRVTENALTNFM